MQNRLKIEYKKYPGSSIIRPLVEFEFGFSDVDEQIAKGNTLQGTKFTGIALVDTGADGIFVKKAMLEACGCTQVTGTAGVPVTWGDKPEITSNLYLAHAYFPAIDRTFRFGVFDAVMDRQDYQVILGTSFLQHGKLTIDIKGESYFDFHPL